MPNFKDTYSSQDNYNHRKNIYKHQSFNETENIVEKAVDYCTNSSDGVCFCVYILLFCVIFICVCVCYFNMPNNEDTYENDNGYKFDNNLEEYISNGIMFIGMVGTGKSEILKETQQI